MDHSWGNPNNWSGHSIPTDVDIAVFGGAAGSGASNDSCTYSGGQSISGLTINKQYTGTLTLNSSLAIRSDGFILSGGTVA
jgi:hypothetical protein